MAISTAGAPRASWPIWRPCWRAQPLPGVVGIGHTRWATHGRPSETNAHPHATDRVAVVHNGIIENFQELRDELITQGAEFETETDTEVVAHLLTHAARAPAHARASHGQGDGAPEGRLRPGGHLRRAARHHGGRPARRAARRGLSARARCIWAPTLWRWPLSPSASPIWRRTTGPCSGPMAPPSSTAARRSSGRPGRRRSPAPWWARAIIAIS